MPRVAGQPGLEAGHRLRADFVVIKATLRRPAGLAGWKSLQEWAL